MAKNITNVLKFVFFKGLFATCVWLSFIEHLAWAENLLIFTISLSFVLRLLAVFSDDACKTIAEGRGLRIPSSVTYTITILFAFIFAANGWFFFAFLLIFSSIIQETIISKGEK